MHEFHKVKNREPVRPVALKDSRILNPVKFIQFQLFIYLTNFKIPTI